MKLKCLAQALFAILLLTTLVPPALSATPMPSAKAVLAPAAAKAVKKYSIEQFCVLCDEQ